MSPLDLYQHLVEKRRSGKAVALVTIFRARGSVPRREGSKMLVYPDGSIEGTVGGGEVETRVIREAVAALKEGKIRVLQYGFSNPAKGDPGVCGGEVEILVEPFVLPATVVVIGAGHVGSRVAHLAKWLGFRVVVNDDRPEFASREAVPEADEWIVSSIEELTKKLEITSETYLVLTTRSMEIDVAGIPALLETQTPYLGLIGSRRRWELCAEKLLEAGASSEDLARVISPIGLDVGAETPEEIALSIMAQILMLREGGSGKSMAHSVSRARKKKTA